MDLSIQIRSIDLMLKFMKHDLSDVPSYGYTLQKPPLCRLKPAAYPLERVKPEAVGLSSAAVERFFRSLNADTNLGMHAAMILRYGKVAAEGYWAPYRPEIPHMLYSMSKSITGLAVGMAVDEGLLSIDEKLVDIFPEVPHSKYMRAVTVRDLLTMSTGSRFNELGAMLDGDWVRMFMETLPKFEPGSAFEYNSLNSYMLAAVVCKKSGVSLTEFLTPRLYAPLRIDEHHWEVCPAGIEKGGWGLSLRLEDSAKIGQLFLQRGRWEGRQLVNPQWIAAATSKQIETPSAEARDGYGFQVWMNGNNAYQFNGAFGQYTVILPKYDAVVTIYSGSPRLFAQGPIMALIEECFLAASPDGTPLMEAPFSCQNLCTYLKSLRTNPPMPLEDVGVNYAEFGSLCKALHGREYLLSSNTGGVFPQTVQSVHGNFTLGTNMITFTQGEDALNISFYEGRERNTLSIPANGGFSYQSVAMRGERQLTATRGTWRVQDGQISLVLYCAFLETPNTRIITMRFEGNSMDIMFDESPSVSEAAAMLFHLLGFSEVSFFKRLLPAVRHMPGMSAVSLREMVRRFTLPTAKGYSIAANEDKAGDMLCFGACERPELADAASNTMPQDGNNYA